MCYGGQCAKIMKRMPSWRYHNCGQLTDYNVQYDAYYCTKCNNWTERKCSDSDCGYCTKRPMKPF